MERLISGLVIVMGAIAMVVGVLMAMRRLQLAGRFSRRIAVLSDTMPEGWSSWFLRGFSGITMGTHWLVAAAVLIGWVAAGVCLMSLGLQLFWHA